MLGFILWQDLWLVSKLLSQQSCGEDGCFFSLAPEFVG
jgi:hypothetical protein